MKTVIEMAQDIFDVETDDYGRQTFSADSLRLERFAELVRADEREACALIGDSMASLQDGAIGKAIRARSNT